MSAFVVAILALHLLQPKLNPAQHTISEYALGSYGWLMRSAFFALGVGTLATAAAMRLKAGPSVRRSIGLLLLGGAALGLFIDTGYNTDRLRVPATADGMVHGVGTWILALTLPVAALVLGSYFARTSVSSLRARWIQALGGAQLVAMVAFEVSPDAYRGLAERLVTFLAVATVALLWSLTSPRPDWQVQRSDDRNAIVLADQGMSVAGGSPLSMSD